MDKQVSLLGWLYIIFSALHVLTTAVLMFTFLPDEGHFIARWVTFGMFVIAAPCIVGGIGLLKRKYWAKILILIIGAILLLHFPFGTALGAYTLWLLTRKEVSALFTGQPFQYPKTPVEG